MTTYRHRAFGALPQGDSWTVTMHSNGSAALTVAHTAWVAALTAQFAGTYGSSIPIELGCDGAVTDQLDPSTGHNVAQDSSSLSLKGSISGGNLAPQRTAIVFGLRTATPTRAGRGRMFFPGPDVSALTPEGGIDNTTASNLAFDWADALGTFAATITPVIYHRATRTWTPVTSVTVGQVLGTQRRRTNKVLPAYSSAPL